MNEVKRILDQMDRAFTGDAWHGPPLMQLLNGVSAEDASKHPVRGAHSIWEIVHHISAWNSVVNRRLGGEDVTITHEHDWPPVWEVNEVAWKHALDALSESRARLRKSVAALKDFELDHPPAGTKESRYVTLHGIVQHDLYHAGQIAILKKTLP